MVKPESEAPYVVCCKCRRCKNTSLVKNSQDLSQNKVIAVIDIKQTNAAVNTL